MALTRPAPRGGKHDDCRYCSLIDVNSRYDTPWFHDECLNCQMIAPSSENLCQFCQHLRLRHLFHCRGSAGSGLSRDQLGNMQSGYLTISLGDQDSPSLLGRNPAQKAEHSKKDCSFCGIMANACEVLREYFPKRLIIHPSSYSKIRLDYSSWTTGTEIGFLELVPWPPTTTWNYDLGVYLPENVPPCLPMTVSWVQIKNWLDECVLSHPGCEVYSAASPTHFHLIDVQRRRLIAGDETCRFAALSYVWGQDPDSTKLAAKLSNIEQLKQDGGIEISKLPKTISDAIQVCSQLLIPYLWVDRLCIVQDDNQHKQQQFDEMADIFAAAYLVIVITDGDMNSGIPGVQPRITRLQRQEMIEGLVFMNGLPHLDEIIDHSDWNSRAWTYQESVFARRKLYFSSAQAFFECDKKSQRSEDRISVDYENSNKRIDRNECGWDYEVWKDHLDRYSNRSLTHPSDVYNAFAGITRALIPEDGAFFCGLPRRNFNESLLWRNSSKKKRATCDPVPLPSWSWASTEGNVRVQLGTEFVATLVDWEYQRGPLRPNGMREFSSVQDAEVLSQRDLGWNTLSKGFDVMTSHFEAPDPATKSTQTLCMSKPAETGQKLYRVLDLENAQVIFAIAWSQGCLDVAWPFADLRDRTFLELAADLESRWGSYLDLEREIVHGRSFAYSLASFSKYQEDVHSLSNEKMEASFPQSTIKGRVQSSFFHLEGIDRPIVRTKILGKNGDVVGFLRMKLDDAMAQALPPADSSGHEIIGLSVGYMHVGFLDGEMFLDSNNKSADLRKEIQEFMDRSPKDPETVRKAIPQLCAALGPDGLDFSYLDADGSVMTSIPIINVMLIQWDGLVARRISIGWIFLTKWVKSSPQFKTVYLN